jgi:hypothetical protein
MAVGAWTFFNTFRKNVGSGLINLKGGTFRMVLLTSTAALTAAGSYSTYGGISSNELTTLNGYTAGGTTKGLMTVNWSATPSAGTYRWTYTPARVWTATGGNIGPLKFAAIFTSGASAGLKKLVCFSQLSTAGFTITTGNTLTITQAATGVFQLT